MSHGSPSSFPSLCQKSCSRGGIGADSQGNLRGLAAAERKASAKETPRIEVCGFNPRLDLWEQDLPWAQYSILLGRWEHKLPSVPPGRANAWSRTAVASSLPAAHAVAIAAMSAVKRHGLGPCERRKDVIGKVKKAVRRGGSRLGVVENVSVSKHDGHPRMMRRAVESRARVISKSLRNAVPRKICVIARAAT